MRIVTAKTHEVFIDSDRILNDSFYLLLNSSLSDSEICNQIGLIDYKIFPKENIVNCIKIVIFRSLKILKSIKTTKNLSVEDSKIIQCMQLVFKNAYSSSDDHWFKILIPFSLICAYEFYLKLPENEKSPVSEITRLLENLLKTDSFLIEEVMIKIRSNKISDSSNQFKEFIQTAFDVFFNEMKSLMKIVIELGEDCLSPNQLELVKKYILFLKQCPSLLDVFKLEKDYEYFAYYYSISE